MYYRASVTHKSLTIDTLLSIQSMADETGCVISMISSHGCVEPLSRSWKKRGGPAAYTPREGTKGTRRHPSRPQPIERERNISIPRCGLPRAQRFAV